LSSQQLADLLVNHLNANQYYYNSYAWLLMDPRERRQRLSAYVGNLLAGMSDTPLAMSGNHLAFRYTGKNLPAAAREALPDSIAKLKPRENIVTLPTRGIFAEAHMGHCNAAEKRDITRLWNFDELPVSLLPNIETLTAGPRGAYQGLTPDAMGASPLGIQGTPQLPAPGEAIAKALELLAKPDIFRDQSTREQVAEIMGKLIESAQPPKLSGAGVGSAWGGGQSAKPAVGSGSGGGGTASSPDEWANPFPSRASEGSDGQSYLAERYGSGRTTDETDRLRLAPELAQNLFDTGMTQKLVEDIIGKYTKGTTGKVSRTMPPILKKQTFSIGLKSRSTFAGGVQRALNGNITLDIIPSGNLASVGPISYLIPVNGGVGRQTVTLVTGQYAVNVRYAPSQRSDLDFLREPHLESVGVNGALLIEKVFDLLQHDLATDWKIGAEAEGELFEVPEKCKGFSFMLLAEMEQSQALSFEAELGLQEGFTIAADGSVGFDPSKLADLATTIAATLKIEQAGLVAALLSLFTIKASIDANNKSTITGSQTVKLTFKPAILKRFILTEIK
jgi:hypothetical protein